MEITAISSLELKAAFYDALVTKERCEGTMGAINSELQRRESLPAPAAAVKAEAPEQTPVAPEEA